MCFSWCMILRSSGRGLRPSLVDTGWFYVQYWMAQLSKDPSSRWWLEYRVMFKEKTLVLTFICQTQHRQTCVVSLLKMFYLHHDIGWSRYPHETPCLVHLRLEATTSLMCTLEGIVGRLSIFVYTIYCNNFVVVVHVMYSSHCLLWSHCVASFLILIWLCAHWRI